MTAYHNTNNSVSNLLHVHSGVRRGGAWPPFHIEGSLLLPPRPDSSFVQVSRVSQVSPLSGNLVFAFFDVLFLFYLLCCIRCFFRAVNNRNPNVEHKHIMDHKHNLNHDLPPILNHHLNLNKNLNHDLYLNLDPSPNPSPNLDPNLSPHSHPYPRSKGTKASLWPGFPAARCPPYLGTKGFTDLWSPLLSWRKVRQLKVMKVISDMKELRRIFNRMLEVEWPSKRHSSRVS